MQTTPTDATPCCIARGRIDDGRPTNGTTWVRVHSRTDPCGVVGRETEPVPTFVEFVADWLEDTHVSLQRCQHCGGGL